MPSRHMVRHPIDLYPSNDNQLAQVVNVHKVKRTRFLREAVIFVLNNPEYLQTVITNSKSTSYKKVNR